MTLSDDASASAPSGGLALQVGTCLAVPRWAISREDAPEDAMLIGAVLSALVLGYVAGLWSFKVKARWCPRCGATTNDLLHEHVRHP